MATLTYTLSQSGSATVTVGGKTYRGTATVQATVTATYSTTTYDANVTLSVSGLSCSSFVVTASAGGVEQAKAAAVSDAKTKLRNALSSGSFPFNFDGTTVATRTGVAESTSYTYTGSKSVARSTSTQSKTAEFKGNTATISIPALATYQITYNANSGSGAPATQTKYYGINSSISTTIPSKTGYTFKGWATSEANAKAGTVNYASGATYSGNAGLSLWAVWELTYLKPTITGFDVDRCLQDGALNDEGGYAKIVFDWSVFRSPAARYYEGSTTPYSDNSVSSCIISITDGTTTKIETLTLTGASGSVSAIVGDGDFDTDTQYSVTVSLTDSQTVYNDKTTTVSGVVSTAFFPMDWNSDATAIAFLMPAPENKEGIYAGKDIKMALDVDGNADASHDATSGSDKDLFNAIRALGWYSDCIEE